MLDHLSDHALDRRSEPVVAQGSMHAFVVAVHQPTADVAVVDPSGELDLLSSPVLERCLQDQLRDRRCTQLILDVSRLGFCGAAGLRCLLRARELADAQHIGLSVVSGPAVSRLLSMGSVHEQFDIFTDVPSAMSAASTVGPSQTVPDPASPRRTPRSLPAAASTRPRVL
jgi:anti-anti-sigma factor